jgi:hypothetical protein
LLEAVKSKLGFVIDVEFHRVSHELSADRSDFLRESSAEHHDLLLSRRISEDFLDITSHVYEPD